MPETKPQDYTKRELTQAANVCRDAAKLLDPASDELGRIADDFEAAHVETALFYNRTRRHLLGASFHLKGAEAELRQLAETTGRSYASVKSWYRRLMLGAWLVVMALSLLKVFVLSKHAGQIVADNLPFGVAVAFSAALSILELYITGTRRTDRRRR